MIHSLVDATDAQATKYELWAIHPHAGHHIFKERFAYDSATSNGNTICICLVKSDYELSNDIRPTNLLLRGIISGKGTVFCELQQPVGDPDEDSAVTTRPINTDRFDVRAVLDMVQYCKEHHGLSCNSKPQHLPGFTVLDCETNPVSRLRPEASIPYLALSYVWGSLASPESFSPIIMDAITVTKRLGYRYLWVDQYCIDQADEREKMSQISQMDAIYHNADITIIASASQNQQDGLPGVSCPRTRNPDPPILMGNLKFTKAFPDPGIEIRNSKWATRGWTFQEAVLSRRRLFFMKDQVYYECEGMNQEESVKLNRTKIKWADKLRENIYPVNFGRNDSGFQIGGCEELLVQYTSRDLTFPDDAFNGIKGVWSRLETIDPRLRHVCGLPHTLNGKTDTQPRTFIYEGTFSGPTTDTNFWRSLSWHHTNEAIRRSQFPSWSWLGWAGRIAFSCQDLSTSPGPYSKAKVRFQRRNTKTGVREPEMLALDEVLRRSQDTGEFSLVMHLETECLPQELQLLQRDGQLYCRLHGYEGKVQLSLREPLAETERKFWTGKYRAALIRSTNWTDEIANFTPQDEAFGHSLWFVVLHEEQPGNYKRIGTLSLQQMWFMKDPLDPIVPKMRLIRKAQVKILGYLTTFRFIIE